MLAHSKRRDDKLVFLRRARRQDRRIKRAVVRTEATYRFAIRPRRLVIMNRALPTVHQRCDRFNILLIRIPRLVLMLAPEVVDAKNSIDLLFSAVGFGRKT